MTLLYLLSHHRLEIVDFSSRRMDKHAIIRHRIKSSNQMVEDHDKSNKMVEITRCLFSKKVLQRNDISQELSFNKSDKFSHDLFD